MIDLQLKLRSGVELDALRFDVEQVVHDRLSGIPKIRNQLLAGLLQVY